MSATATSRSQVAEASDRISQNKNAIAGQDLEMQEHEDLMRESIQRLAYALWEQRGRPEGSSDDDWKEAEQQIRVLQNETMAAGR